jgi:hypothetical protein
MNPFIFSGIIKTSKRITAKATYNNGMLFLPFP